MAVTDDGWRLAVDGWWYRVWANLHLVLTCNDTIASLIFKTFLNEIFKDHPNRNLRLKSNHETTVQMSTESRNHNTAFCFRPEACRLVMDGIFF